MWRGKETKEKFVVPNFSNMAIRRFTADKIPSQGFPHQLLGVQNISTNVVLRVKTQHGNKEGMREIVIEK